MMSTEEWRQDGGHETASPTRAAGAGPPSRVLFCLDYFLTFHKGGAVILTIRFIDELDPNKRKQ